MSKCGWYTFKSDNGSYYLYSNAKKSFICISDKFEILLSLYKEGNDLSEFLEEKSNEQDTDYKEWIYNYKLFILLKENGYFDDFDRNYFCYDRLTVQNYNIENCQSLCFELTQSCNLNCTYCTYGDLYDNEREGSSKILSFDNAKLMIDYAKENFKNNTALTIGFYGGEPLLNFSLLKKIVDYAENQLGDVVFQMTTNGVLLDQYMDYIVEKEFKLAISLDGDSKNNIYRIYHNGKQSFEKVVENIELLKNAWGDYFQNYVQILSVINSTSNVNEISQFFYDKFQIHPHFSNLSQVDIKKTKLDQFNKVSTDFYNFYEDYKSEFVINDKLKQTLPVERDLFDTLKAYCGNFYKSYFELFLNKKSSRMITGTCVPFEKLFITTAGKILPCEGINQKHYFGEIRDGQVFLDPNNVINGFNKYLDEASLSCENCYIIEKCDLCVFQCGINEDNKTCRNIRNEEEFIKMLSDNISYLEKNPELYNKMSKRDYHVEA